MFCIWLLLFGIAIGVVSGWLGIGGGVLLIPGLILLFGFSQAEALALVGTVMGSEFDADPVAAAMAAVVFICYFGYIWWLLTSIQGVVFPKDELAATDRDR